MKFTVGCYELYKLLKFVGSHKSEVVFHVENDVLWTRAIDPANICIIEAYIPIANVEIGEGEDNKFVVDIDRLANIIEKKKKLIVDFDVGDGVLKCRKGNITYSVRLLTYEEGLEPKELSLELPAKITMGADEFRQLLDVASKVGDTIEFNRGRPMVKGDFETLTLNVGEEECEEVAKYSVPYLETLKPVLEKTATITIEYGTGKPAKITVLDGEEKYVMILAPRIDVE